MPTPMKYDIKLPSHLYAEVAPVCVPVAEHLLNRLQRKYHLDAVQSIEKLLSLIQSKRRYAFSYLDSFVLNRDLKARDALRLSSSMLRDALAVYSDQPIPNSTFNDWIIKGAIRLESKGRPLPDWAAGTYIARMIDDGERNFLPEKIDDDEPAWWCYAQRPSEPLFVCPLDKIDTLPPNTLLWTPWAGAAWDNKWKLIGEGEGNLGAIRFVGVKTVRGQYQWNITFEDVIKWDSATTDLYINFEGASETQVQDLANVALNRLARTRLWR